MRELFSIARLVTALWGVNEMTDREHYRDSSSYAPSGDRAGNVRTN